MIHEIAHAMLHDLDTGQAAGVDQKTREVQAESVAYTVSPITVSMPRIFLSGI